MVKRFALSPIAGTGLQPLPARVDGVKSLANQGPIAQLGERHNGIVEVMGSSPIRSTVFIPVYPDAPSIRVVPRTPFRL